MSTPAWPKPPEAHTVPRWHVLHMWFGVGVFGACLALAVGFFSHLDAQFHGPDPKSEAGMGELRQITWTARPLIRAVERFQKDKGRAPNTLLELYPKYLSPSTVYHDDTGSSWGRWRYDKQSSASFHLYYKINWDAGIRYESDNPPEKRWRYDPGDGSPSTPIIGP